MCIWLGPPRFSCWFSFAVAHGGADRGCSFLFLKVIYLILMRWLGCGYFYIVGSVGARGGVGWLWGCFASPPPTPSVVCSADRSGAVVLVLFLFLVALCSCVVPALLSVVVVFCCFFVLFWVFSYMCCVASILVTVFNSCPLCFLFY